MSEFGKSILVTFCHSVNVDVVAVCDHFMILNAYQLYGFRYVKRTFMMLSLMNCKLNYRAESLYCLFTYLKELIHIYTRQHYVFKFSRCRVQTI